MNTGNAAMFPFSNAAEVEAIWGMDLLDGLWLKRFEGFGKWELDLVSSKVSSSGDLTDVPIFLNLACTLQANKWILSRHTRPWGPTCVN